MYLKNLREESVGGWLTQISDSQFVLPQYVVEQCIQLVEQSTQAFSMVAFEPTAAQRLLGVPSPIVRMDFTLTTQGDPVELTLNSFGDFVVPRGPLVVQPYELEERPGGIGLTCLINPQCSEILHAIMRDWPRLVSVLGNNDANEDHLWLGQENIFPWPTLPPDDGSLVLVRAEPGQKEYHHLQERSLMSLTMKGHKDYGQVLGWWRSITSIAELPERGSGIVVIKAPQCSKAKGVFIAPSIPKLKQPSMVSRGRLERELVACVAEQGKVFLQPWHQPMGYMGENLILRVLFARKINSPKWSCLGGLYNIRREVIVHGAKNTVMGPAVLG